MCVLKIKMILAIFTSKMTIFYKKTLNDWKHVMIFFSRNVYKWSVNIFTFALQLHIPSRHKQWLKSDILTCKVLWKFDVCRRRGLTAEGVQTTKLVRNQTKRQITESCVALATIMFYPSPGTARYVTTNTMALDFNGGF